MIEHREGDLLEQADVTHIAHQANLWHAFGSGLALAIKKKFPKAYEADLQTGKGDPAKLGSWSVALLPGGRHVVNLYAQVGISGKHRTTSYDAMDKGLRELEAALAGFSPVARLGIPYGMGCGLAGGSWKVVGAIVEDAFAKSPLEVVVCRLPRA